MLQILFTCGELEKRGGGKVCHNLKVQFNGYGERMALYGGFNFLFLGGYYSTIRGSKYGNILFHIDSQWLRKAFFNQQYVFFFPKFLSHKRQ